MLKMEPATQSHPCAHTHTREFVLRNLSERIFSWLQVERKHYMHKFKCKLYHRVLIPRARRNVNESCLGGMCVCLCYHTETSGTRPRFAQCSSSTKVTDFFDAYKNVANRGIASRCAGTA